MCAAYDADALINAAQRRIEDAQAARSACEPSWDGFCGLLKLNDDVACPVSLPPPDASTDGSAAASSRSADPADAPAGADEQLLRQLEQQLRRAAGEPASSQQQRLLQVAETAYVAGSRLLQRGAHDQAAALLTLALDACPPRRTRARRKIQDKLAQLGM